MLCITVVYVFKRGIHSPTTAAMSHALREAMKLRRLGFPRKGAK